MKSADLASHGFEALAELDQDQNLQIDASDPIFPSLLLWKDINRNGVSEPAELRPLQDAGFRGLSTDAKRSDGRDQWGNRFQYRATVFGSAPVLHRFAYDVFLAKADSRVH